MTMSAEKHNFLAQPVVKNLFVYRNGDPYFEARRIVINQKRVCNFETLLKEVTGGIQAPFGAVRNIYTPRGGHRVDCLESLQSGEQYVAAGREKFKKLDYLQIGTRKKRTTQAVPAPVRAARNRSVDLASGDEKAKPVPQSRIVVSARFLKPIKEPCPIFVAANGDVINPAIRLLIHQKVLDQYDKILELITERMGLRVLGGVRSLYTFDGQQVTDGKQLESGQLYVAVGREKFKRMPYSESLYLKTKGAKRGSGVKNSSLPPIYRLSKTSGTVKPTVRSSDSGTSKGLPSAPAGNNSSSNKEKQLSSIVREISQARLISLRKMRSRQSITDNDDQDSKADDGNVEDKTPQDQPAEEQPTAEDSADGEETETAGEKEESSAENASNDDKEKEGTEEPNVKTVRDSAVSLVSKGKSEKEEEVKEETKEEVSKESNKKDRKGREQVPSNHTPSANDKDVKDGQRAGEVGQRVGRSRDLVNGGSTETVRKEKEKEDSQSDNKTRGGDSISTNGDQADDDTNAIDNDKDASGEEETIVNGGVDKKDAGVKRKTAKDVAETKSIKENGETGEEDVRKSRSLIKPDEKREGGRV